MSSKSDPFFAIKEYSRQVAIYERRGRSDVQIEQEIQERVRKIITQLSTIPDFPVEKFIERSYFVNDDYVDLADFEYSVKSYGYIEFYNPNLTDGQANQVILKDLTTGPGQHLKSITRISNLAEAVYYDRIAISIRKHIPQKDTYFKTYVDDADDWDTLSLLRYRGMVIFANDKSTLDPQYRPFANVSPPVAFEVTRRLADSTYHGYTPIKLEETYMEGDDDPPRGVREIPWWVIITQPFPATATADDVIHYLQEYQHKFQIEHYGPGSQFARETIDQPERVAAACGDAATYSYRALEMIASQSLDNATSEQLCQIVAKYPGQIVLEDGTTCQDYSRDEIISSIKQILKELPKINLCGIISASSGSYPTIHEEIVAGNAQLYQNKIVMAKQVLLDAVLNEGERYGIGSYRTRHPLDKTVSLQGQSYDFSATVKITEAIGSAFGVTVNSYFTSVYPEIFEHSSPPDHLVELFPQGDSFITPVFVAIICLQGSIDIVMIKNNVTRFRLGPGALLVLRDFTITFDGVVKTSADNVVLLTIDCYAK